MAKKIGTLLSLFNSKDKQHLHPYQKAEQLMTATQLQFFNELKQIVGDHYIICAQVNMDTIVNLKKGLESKLKALYQKKLKSKNIDFVLCNPKDSNIVVAIELDDKSIKGKKEMETTMFKHKLFKAINLPHLKFEQNQHSYTDEIIDKLSKHLAFDKYVSRTNSEPSLPKKEQDIKKIMLPAASSKDLLCPKCLSTMVTRISEKRKPVLACSTYPACKTIIALDQRKKADSDTVRLS